MSNTQLSRSFNNDSGISLLRLPIIIQRTGFSRSYIYLSIARGDFPRPIKIGRMSGWVSREIDNWIVEKIQCGRLGA